MTAAQDARHLAAAWVLIVGTIIVGIAYALVFTGNASVRYRAWQRRRSVRRTVDSVKANAAVRHALRKHVEQDYGRMEDR